MSMLLTGVGNKDGIVSLAPGYYILKTAALPTKPVPSSPLWATATTKMNDGSADDQTTEEAVSISGIGTIGTIEILFVGTLSTWATERITLRYGIEGPTFTTEYWDGAAYQAWSSPSTTPHIGDTFETYALNPTNRDTMYLLFTGTCTGGGTGTDWAISDWRPST